MRLHRLGGLVAALREQSEGRRRTFMMSEGTAGQPSRRMYSSTSTTACFTCNDSLTAQPGTSKSCRRSSVPQTESVL